MYINMPVAGKGIRCMFVPFWKVIPMQVWNPCFRKDIQCVERVQRFFTRVIIKRAGIPYMEYDDCLSNHREKNGSNQSFDFIKDFKSSVKSLCD